LGPARGRPRTIMSTGSASFLKAEALPVGGAVLDEHPAPKRSIDDVGEPDDGLAALLGVGETHMGAGRVTQNGDCAADLGDPVRVDQVGRKAVEIAAPGGDVGVPADDGWLVENPELVVNGHEPAETLDVAPVDAVNEADHYSHGWKRAGAHGGQGSRLRTLGRAVLLYLDQNYLSGIAKRKPAFRELEPVLRDAVRRGAVQVPESGVHRIESAARPDLALLELLRELSGGLELGSERGAAERRCESALRTALERDHPDREPEPGDQRDLEALSLALPRCDLVTCDAFMADLIHRARLDVWYPCEVFTGRRGDVERLRRRLERLIVGR
jgi:hypothetical protein